MRTKVIMTICLFLLMVGKASAQWSVIDPTNIAQSIINSSNNIVHTSSTAQNMINNFKETVKIYEQEQKTDGDAGGQKKQPDPNHWLNEDGTIRRLNTYFKKELTEQQKDDYVAGKTIEIKEVPNKNGSGTYTAYVKFDFDKMQPRSYRNNPDLKQAKEQIPTNENKVQVAVNEQGKTHEATKHTKEPLSPGQSAPKNEKQQKEQNAEEQKPKRKARSVKM